MPLRDYVVTKTQIRFHLSATSRDTGAITPTPSIDAYLGLLEEQEAQLPQRNSETVALAHVYSLLRLAN